jgi:hypothetical protein
VDTLTLAGPGAGEMEPPDEASAAGLNAFLDLCGRAAASACAFSAGTPAAIHAKWNTLLDRLASHPVTVAGTTVTRAVAVVAAVNGLDRALPIPNLTNGWPDLATLLLTLWALTNGSPAPARTVLPAQDVMFAGLGLLARADAPYAGREALLGVDCSDSPNLAALSGPGLGGQAVDGGQQRPASRFATAAYSPPSFPLKSPVCRRFGCARLCRGLLELGCPRTRARRTARGRC